MLAGEKAASRNECEGHPVKLLPSPRVSAAERLSYLRRVGKGDGDGLVAFHRMDVKSDRDTMRTALSFQEQQTGDRVNSGEWARIQLQGGTHKSRKSIAHGIRRGVGVGPHS